MFFPSNFVSFHKTQVKIDKEIPSNAIQPTINTSYVLLQLDEALVIWPQFNKKRATI